MMPLKGVFQWWRALGVPEKGVVVGVAPQWALDLEPLVKTPEGYDAPEWDVLMVANPRRP